MAERQTKTFKTVAYEIKPYMAKIFCLILEDEQGNQYLFSTNGETIYDKIAIKGIEFKASYVQEVSTKLNCFVKCHEYQDLTLIKNLKVLSK